jgi:hypothetical protein
VNRLLLFLAFVSGVGLAQTRQPDNLLQQQQMMSGGIGMTVIDGKPYYLFNLAPELTFGKLGVGLDLNIRVGEDGQIRTEDFDEAYDYLRIIRYIRWGSKREPLSVRVGALDHSRIGHGFILYMYRNSASYDQRKFGAEFDMDFEQYGFESMYSDLAGRGVFGARGYLKPLKYSTLANLPVIGELETGVTIASDLHHDANKTWGDGTGTKASAVDNGSLSIVGVDVGLPVLSLSSLQSTLYTDLAHIIGYGTGLALGIDLNFSGLGIATIGLRYERRFLSDQFIPSYFNALYERERFIPVDSTRFLSKAQLLAQSKAPGPGYYGEVNINILGTFAIVGGYQAFDDLPNSGTFHASLESGSALPGILLSAGYDRKNIGQVFRLDENSLLYAQVGYKPMPFLIVSTLYEWTFVEEKNSSGQVIGYKTQKRIEPKVGFLFYF